MNRTKFIALSLAFLLISSFTVYAAPAEEAADSIPEVEEAAPEAQFCGEWYGDFHGLPLCLDLKEDGVYTVAFSSAEKEPREGTWEFHDGFIFLDGEEIPSISVLKEKLRWSAGGIFLGREEPEIYIPAAVYQEAVPEDFDGYWTSVYVDVDGVLMEAAALQDNTDIYIEGTNVALGGPFFGDVLAEFTYADGALIYQDGDGYASVQISMQMLEDGILSVTLSSAGEDLKIFLTPAYTPYGA